jgi:hypothetical protein
MRSVVLCVLVGSAGGCAPTIPFHLTETAAVLARHQVAISVTGGGGDGTSTNEKLSVDRCCGGGALRARVGLGGRHEVGAELAVIAGNGKGGPVFPTGKLRYKLGLGEHLAFLAGLGLAGRIDTSGGSANALYVGADAGLVASTSPLANIVQLYGGLRFTFSLPADDRFYANTPTQGFIVPAGLALRAGQYWQLYAEGGLIGGFSEPSRDQHYGWIGGYGAFAVEYRTQ